MYRCAQVTRVGQTGKRRMIDEEKKKKASNDEQTG